MRTVCFASIYTFGLFVFITFCFFFLHPRLLKDKTKSWKKLINNLVKGGLKFLSSHQIFIISFNLLTNPRCCLLFIRDLIMKYRSHVEDLVKPENSR